MQRAEITFASNEPVADCLRVFSPSGETELTKATLSIHRSLGQKVNCVKLQRSLFKRNSSRCKLGTCLTTRHQRNNVRRQKAQLKRFQNMHPSLT